MSMIRATRITVFGGGTSGWLAAAYLTRNLTYPHEITLIESTAIGPIGVGEGTQPATARYLYDCGLQPKDWMKPSQAAFKLGVEFDGWTDEKYFVDNDFIENTIIGPNLYTPDYFISKSKQEYFDWLPAYQMARANKSPKLAGLDTNYALTGTRQFGAVHFSAFDIVKSIKDLIGNQIQYFDTKVVKIETDQSGIKALMDEEGRTHTADLFIDCSGFGSVLLEKHLKVDFMSIEDILPCDKAVALPTQYSDPQKECHPFTRSTAMTAGWRWTIPIFSRIGNGYVYSSKFISPEDAEKELREAVGEFDAKSNHLDMKCGIHKVVAHKNVCAAGLSAGFVEPLEATGITFTTKAIEMLTMILNQSNGMWHQTGRNKFNEVYDRMFWEIVAFVWAHYHFSTKKDTQFWKKMHSQSPDVIPQKVKDIVARFVPNLHRDFFIHPESSFHVGHWFSVLHAGDVYKDHPEYLGGDLLKYAEYFLKNNTSRVKFVGEMFPNHYDFLKDWYGREDNPF